MKNYFYSLLSRYISFFIPEDSTLRIHEPTSNHLKEAVQALRPELRFVEHRADYLVLSGNLHFDKDIQIFLENLKKDCQPSTRLLITYYSSLWRPAVRLADFFGLRSRPQGKNENWISPIDLRNLLELSGYELIITNQRVLFPLYIPLFSYLVNRWLAPLPFFRHFSLINIAVARLRVAQAHEENNPSVSVVVAARNEAGNIHALFERLPLMGSRMELIIVEGGSTDDTWETIQQAKKEFSSRFSVITAKQEGRGKGDAIRKGFSLASGDILMILDADLTVPPEDLPKFYRAMASGLAEFVNGSRLVYPMEGSAMRFFNIIGNKFFAAAFSFTLGQPFKDTLCGTKVVSKKNYERIAASRNYFGDFDPFGDFDLLFGASRLGLRIVELPIRYRDRVYGETNISRWSHGWLLLRMVIFASKRIKFL
jgi:hypothetical protein